MRRQLKNRQQFFIMGSSFTIRFTKQSRSSKRRNSQNPVRAGPLNSLSRASAIWPRRYLSRVLRAFRSRDISGADDPRIIIAKNRAGGWRKARRNDAKRPKTFFPHHEPSQTSVLDSPSHSRRPHWRASRPMIFKPSNRFLISRG